MIYGLIFAAGKQTRFACDTPKALITIGNRVLLDINMERLSKHCDEIFVVCSYENAPHFKNYPNIKISSGNGCGDAVMQALDRLPLSEDDLCYIMWGDTLFTEELLRVSKDSYSDRVVIPCEIVDTPYVQIIPINDGVKVKFSKFGESTFNGYHDLSVFFGNAMEINSHLHKMHDQIYINNTYVHTHGNEFSFLDVFNDTNIRAKVVLTPYKSYAFNTLEESTILEKLI